MDRKLVPELINALNYYYRPDLSKLFTNSRAKLNESGEYGSKWGFTRVSVIIISPIPNQQQIDLVSEEDLQLIKKAVGMAIDQREDKMEVFEVLFNPDLSSFNDDVVEEP